MLAKNRGLGWGWGVGVLTNMEEAPLQQFRRVTRGTPSSLLPSAASTYPQADLWAQVRDKVVLASGLGGAEC